MILLSQYYETGEIYHLSPIKRMAVELSALVVYNHTLKYDYMTGEKGNQMLPQTILIYRSPPHRVSVNIDHGLL